MTILKHTMAYRAWLWHIVDDFGNELPWNWHTCMLFQDLFNQRKITLKDGYA